MAKKNLLNKVGGTVVMTVAMAAALATPVSATEVDPALDITPAPAPASTPTPAPASTPAPAPASTPAPAPESTPAPAPESTPTPAPASTPTPAPASTPTPAPASTPTPAPASTPTPTPASDPVPASDTVPTPVPTSTDTTPGVNSEQPVIPAEFNKSVESSNEEALKGNEETLTDNEIDIKDNQDTIEKNEELSGGEVTDPELPELNAPETPNTDGLSEEEYNKEAEEYNKEAEEYNKEAEEYNKEAEEYNDIVGEYNKEVEDFNTKADEKYQQDLEDYQQEEQDHQELVDQYEKDKGAYDTKDAAYQDYLQKLADYETKMTTYESLMTQYETDSEEYKINKEAYDKAVAEYQNYLKEKGIYDWVNDYNDGITDKNDFYEGENEKLENDMNVGTVENISQVGDNNAEIEIDLEIKTTLEDYHVLAEMQAELLKKAAELEAHPGKDADLGSQDYANYLQAVADYNIEVTEFNSMADTYNAAVAEYNAAVEAYNQKNQGSSSSSTGSTTDTGTADWGNIQVTETNWWGQTVDVTFSHIDVKYTAAVGKDKVTEDGETKYVDSGKKYDVVGVYTSEEAYDQNKNSYGLTYTNNDNSGSSTQGLTKNNNDSEFRTTSHNAASLDVDEGKISCYVILRDEEGNEYDLTVSLEDTDVYPDGTYYAGANKKNLANYRDSNGKGLETTTIDGVTYYDISGQSVFVISALTCDGASFNNGKVNPDGLDLVLNVQTLIQITQAKNAEKISYAGYELGKTAQQGELITVEKPGDPPEEPNKPEKPDKPDPVDPPGEEPKDPGSFDKTAPVQPTHLKTLETVGTLNLLGEKLIMVIPPADPGVPMLLDDPGFPVYDPTIIVNELNILDEAVPLAKAPKTGDISMLWAALSGFSLGGFSLLNRKRKGEE